MGTLMKFLGALPGAKAEPDYTLRGFLGVDLEDKEGRGISGSEVGAGRRPGGEGRASRRATA